MYKKITSPQNPTIKNCILLTEKAKERKKQNLIIVEGLREIWLAIEAGHDIKTLFFCPEIIDEQTFENFAQKLSQKVEIVEVNEQIFNKIAYRESGGLCAILQPKLLTLADLQLSQNPAIVVLEGIEKPGNLGAILRTTDAAKIDAVILCDSGLELHNPNAIRASLGSIFTQQIVSCESEKAIEFLKKANINIYSAALTATKFYHEINFRQATAIAMGSEAFGLSEKWLKNCNQAIKIPMRGKVDSMNLSVSTAILVFEMMRQRGF